MELSNIDASLVHSADQIPYLPVSMFKNHEIRSILPIPQEMIFQSSTTSGQGASRHFVPYSKFYESVFQKAFEIFYGSPAEYRILALLPSYLDRPDSSLIYMMKNLMDQARNGSNFYRQNLDELAVELQNEKGKTLLFGVTYACLDLAELLNAPLNENIKVMVTGGMKGRRGEMVQAELYAWLKSKLGIRSLHSEYGMTELMSQAYSKDDGIFQCPPWMKVVAFQTTDPGQRLNAGKTGRLCITDLANLYSCAFIASDDLGKTHEDGSFELAGRLDFSDIRGCNLMWT